MGKGQRSREARAGKREEMRKAAAKKRRRQKINKIAAICVAIIVIISILGVIVYNSIANTGFFLRNTVSMSTDNYKVDNAMMSYYIKNQYFSFADTYADYLTMYGLDTTKSLKSQAYGEDGTWFDYFADETKNQLADILVWAEEAKAQGYELDEKDHASIDETIETFKSYAESNNISLKEYLSRVFGTGIKESDIRRALELTSIYSKYYDDYVDALEYTDEDLQNYFDENKESFIKADYISYAFTASTNADMSDEEIAAAKSDAKAKAESLISKGTEEAFKEQLSEYLTADLTAKYEEEAENAEDTAKETTEETEEELSIEEKVQADIEKEFEAIAETKAYTEKEDDAVGLWMFNKDRVVGDTYIEEPKEDATTYTYTAYLITKTSYFDEYETANVRHIFFSTEENETAEAALEKAKEVLKTYNESETKTEDYFVELAKKNSDDVNVETNGGLYENVTTDSASYPEEFYTWALDETRKEGDVEIIETESGAHIMYYCGKGEIAWKVSAKAGKKAADIESYTTELAAKYALTTNDKKIDKIDM